MNTTISNNGLPPLPPTTTSPGSSGSQAGTAAATGSTSAQTTDSIKLTDSARALQQATTTQSPVDTARVEHIRKSLADGSYSVDAGKIADRLVSLESQINGTS